MVFLQIGGLQSFTANRAFTAVHQFPIVRRSECLIGAFGPETTGNTRPEKEISNPKLALPASDGPDTSEHI